VENQTAFLFRLVHWHSAKRAENRNDIFIVSCRALFSRLVVIVRQDPYNHKLINMNTPTIMVNA
jgi:hypothetical protein